MKFLITGGSSYIGKSIKAFLLANNHEVFEVGRRCETKWALGDSLPLFDSIDFFIHIAYDRSRNLIQNLQDVNQLFSTYKGKSIFISTMSAHSESLSIYGRSKFAQEEVFSQNEGVTLKLGLVMGDGAEGIVSILQRIVHSFRYIPVPRYVKSKLRITPISLVLREISHHIGRYEPGVYMVSLEDEYDLEDILRKFSIENNLNRSFVRIDTRFLDKLLIKLVKSSIHPTIFDSYLSLLADISQEEICALDKCKVCTGESGTYFQNTNQKY